MSNPGTIFEQIASDLTNTMSEKATGFLEESNSKAAYDKALTLGEQIANYTCKELNEQIPPMITSTTNEIIKQLTAKIDSEKFTTDFINVLQTKLLDDNSPYSEQFLSKFDDLFDKIIKDAEKRRNNKEYAKEKEEQGYNSMSQDQETIIAQLKAENDDLKKSLSVYYDDIDRDVPVDQGSDDIDRDVPVDQGSDNNGSTTTGKKTTEILGQQVLQSGVPGDVVIPHGKYGYGRRKHSKSKKPKKKPTKQTKRVRFSTKK